MDSTDRERFDALEESINQILRNQEEIRRRLVLLEEAAGLSHTPVPPSSEPFPSAAVQTPQAGTEFAAPRQFETRMGLTWINRVGVITLVLGVAFFFVYAVENRWIGETTRVLMGVTAGAAALLLAERIRRGGHRTYAQGICGAGIAILYLSFYAAFGLYHLITQPLAFALMVLTTIVAAGFSVRSHSVAIAALGLFGGYITPLLSSTPENQRWFTLTYVLLLDLGALYLAERQRWTSLQFLAFLSTACLYAGQFETPLMRTALTLFALAYYGLFALLKSRFISLTTQLLAILALAGIWEGILWPYIPIAFGLSVAGLAIADRRDRPLGAIITLISFWLSYAAWYVQAPTLALFAFLTAAFLLFIAWAPWRSAVRGVPIGWWDLLLVILNAGFYLAGGHQILKQYNQSLLGMFALFASLVHTLFAFVLWTRTQRLAMLFGGVAYGLLGLAAPLQFSGYRVTMLWAAEAAALAWIGVQLREERAVYASLGVFGLVVLQLFAADSWLYTSPFQYTALANARFLTFLVAAASFWAAAHWIKTGWPALADYLAGHFMLLWSLGMEVFGWAARSTTAENLQSVRSISLSILIAGYAVTLVAIGMATQTTINRILGLGLIGFVVVKLYLHDVWFLGLFYRMAAFAVLGALLLVMSYLYSRFRISIDAWWRERSRGN